MPEDGPVRGAAGRRTPRHDVVRWIFAMVITAVVASAATSAMFLAVRPTAVEPDPFAEDLSRASAQWQELAPSLEKFARAAADTNNAPSSDGEVVEVRFVRAPADSLAAVPVVAVDDRSFAQITPTLWELHVRAQSGKRRFGKIVDIRRAASLSKPGYVGEVEFEMDSQVRTHSAHGELPLVAPPGFQVVSRADYTELSQSSSYSQVNVSPASASNVEETFRFAPWDPAQPPPPGLPQAAGEHFHEAILQCIASPPQESTETQTVLYFYSLRDGQWTAL